MNNKFLSNVKGFLLDIHGVIHDGTSAIEGSINAVKRLQELSVPLRFCTNDSQNTVNTICNKLNRLGFTCTQDQIFSPLSGVIDVLKKDGLRPFPLVHIDIKKEFDSIQQADPNCVVLGDAAQYFTYDNMNIAFNILLKQEHNPRLISMGQGKFYKENGVLNLDVGPYMKALEFATGVKGEVYGKPAKDFFLKATHSMGLSPNQVAMIGDDILNDVGAAQTCGIKGIQVRTGKYRSIDEPHPSIIPDLYVNNLLEAVEIYSSEIKL